MKKKIWKKKKRKDKQPFDPVQPFRNFTWERSRRKSQDRRKKWTERFDSRIQGENDLV